MPDTTEMQNAGCFILKRFFFSYASSSVSLHINVLPSHINMIQHMKDTFGSTRATGS